MKTDVRALLAEVDRSAAPDLWEDARLRTPGPLPPDEDRRPRVRAAAVGIAIAVIAAAVVVQTFRTAPADDVPTDAVRVISGELETTVESGEAFPEGVAVGEGAVWFVTSDNVPHGTLSRVDASAGVVQEIPFDSPPGWETGGGGITTGLGAVWTIGTVAGPGECDLCNSVVLTRVDPASAGTQEVQVGPGAGADVWVDETGIWVLAFPRHEPDVLWLYRLDPTTYEVLGRTDIAAGWSRQVFAAGGWLWVFGSTMGMAPAETLIRIDPATAQVVDELELGGHDLADVEPSGSLIWYCHNGLRAVDATTGEEAVGPVDGVPGDEYCAEIVADGEGGVWILQHPDRIYHVGNDGSLDALGSVPFGQPLSQATFDATTGVLWVMNYDDLLPFELHLGDAVQPTGPVAYLPLYFLQPPEGWHTVDHGPVEDGSVSVAWASTVPIDERDLDPLSPAIPIHTIEDLPADAVVVATQAIPWAYGAGGDPYPPASLRPLELGDAMVRGRTNEEPPGDYTVYEISGGYVLARVYFGREPDAEQVAGAQGVLDTLEIPPVCPVPQDGPLQASTSRSGAAPGDTITLSGPMPFQLPDGSYDRSGSTQVIAWWNADPEDWPYLASFSTASPSPAGPGPLLRLGDGGVGACSYSIEFEVPDVPPGTYHLVLVQEGPIPEPDGAALMGPPIDISVVAPN